jgi:hypothetical protein
VLLLNYGCGTNGVPVADAWIVSVEMVVCGIEAPPERLLAERSTLLPGTPIKMLIGSALAPTLAPAAITNPMAEAVRKLIRMSWHPISTKLLDRMIRMTFVDDG